MLEEILKTFNQPLLPIIISFLYKNDIENKLKLIKINDTNPADSE